MSKFTEGKWRVLYFPEILGIVDEDNDPIQLNEANARLIAAAPKMYWLLKVLDETDIPDEDRFHALLLAKSEARKALAQIDGKEIKNGISESTAAKG